MTDLELEQAYDEVCNGCDLATRKSSDGGKMPCNNHKLLFMQRTYPVIHMTNFWDGEWTDTWVDEGRIMQLLVAIIEGYQESPSDTPDQYVQGLGLSVEQMTKEDFERIPEL